MRRLFASLLWCSGFAVLFCALQAEDAKRVAVLDFVLQDSPGSHDAATTDFSRAVQARLLAGAGFAWVERQEFERLSREADLGGVGRGDPATAVRLGKLARADLLLRGDIATQASGAGQLNLEVVDLKRAEVMAIRAIPMSLTPRRRLQVTAAEVNAAASGALAALQEAAHKVEQVGSAVAIAPLYFKNISRADRAGFIGERVRQALVAAATPDSGMRVLQFPRPAQAGEESSLVLAGLTDADPNAWQQVADAYVWGTIKEDGVDGVEFADVPVTVTLQVLDKVGGLREVVWTGPVKTLDAGLGQLARDVNKAVHDGRAAPPVSGVSRQKIAEDLRQRAAEIWKGIMQEQVRVRPAGMYVNYLDSTPGRQLFAYQLSLLEMACFFNPLDAGLQQARLEAAWTSNPAQPLATLRGHWLRVADYEAQAMRFGKRADGAADPAWSRVRAKQLIELVAALDRAPWTHAAGAASPEDIQRQRRAAVLRWTEIVTAPGLVALATDDDDKATMEELNSLKDTAGDLVTTREVMERALPALKKVVGRFLKDPSQDQARQQFINALYSVYDAYGEYDHLKELLDASWAAGTPPSPTAQLRPPPPARSDRPWKPAAQSVPPPIPAGPAAPLPVLETSAQEINVWPSMGYFQFMRGSQGFRRTGSGLIDTLTWHDGRLWIAQSGQPLPREEGPANPQGGSTLWRYDPARHVSEYMTPALGGHSPVRAMLPAGADLWLALDADGVFRRSGADAAVQRFRAEDGVMSPRMLAAQAGHDELFFLGGTPPNYSISRYSTSTGKWSGMQVPPSTLPANMQGGLMGLPAIPGIGGPPAPQLAACGEWLCVGTPAASFYHLPTNTWTNLLAPADGPRGPAQPATITVFSLVTADDAGFWLGNPGQLVFLDPRAPEARKTIALPGNPLAAAHHGPWLWLLIANNAGIQLVLVDKAAATVAGAAPLPQGWFNKLAVTDDRVWAGGSKLLEIALRKPRPADGKTGEATAAKPDIFQAVWQGDGARLAETLSANPDVNQASASGWTPLMTAIASGRKDLAEQLLARHATPNLMTANGQSALQLAVEKGDAGLVDLLLMHGADANLRLPLRVQGLPPVRQPMEDLALPEESKFFPSQATGLTAALTSEGTVALAWQEHDNRPQVRYQVTRNSALIADLPPGAGRFVDRQPAWGAGEVTYSVLAWNISGRNAQGDAPRIGENEKLFPEAKLAMPATPPPSVVRLAGNFTVGGPAVALPLRVAWRPALAMAAALGQEEIVQRFVAAGADLNLRDALGETPLMATVREGKYTAARRLLAAGADATGASTANETAAGIAYLRHDDETFFWDLMVALPAAARAREASTLMIEAADRGQIKDLELLRSLGGDFNAVGPQGETALSRAIARDQEAMALWLLDQGFVLHRTIRQSSGPEQTDRVIWAAAVRNNRPAVVKRLLSAGCDPNLKVDGKPLVILAAELKAFETLVLLRDAGADLSQPTSEGRTLVQFLPEDQARALLPGKTTGSWPMPRGKDGYTAAWTHPAKAADPAKQPLTEQLVAACKAGDVVAAAAAIRAGAEIDQQGEDGLTALHHALMAQHPAAVRLLVAEGASVNVTSRGGNSPLNFAIQNGQQMEMIEFLLAQGADPNACGERGYAALYSAVVTPNHAALTRLLATSAAVNLHWMDYDTGHLRSALTMALLKGDEEGTAKLLAAGANPRAQTYSFVQVENATRQENKPSLLMFAAYGRKLALVKQMIALGQDPKFKTHEGYDALAWAATAKAKEVVEYLLPLSDHKGRALESAREKGYTDIAQLLEQAGYQAL
ncbi:MAG: ankyrin repeat domain-containing protein [Opitutae bacterium]|nr:ankyrin repeat domain-containing protein [Opitutae bacterium]